MSIKSLSIVAGAALALCAGAAQANGFANGGFENVGTTTPAESWLAAAAGYSLSTDARTGNYAAQLSSPALNAAVMLQNSVEQGGLAPLVEGVNPLLSFWAKGNAGTTGNVLFALRYLDGVGNILANSTNVFFQNSINESTWTEIKYDLGAVPTGAVAAFIEFSQSIGPIDPGAGLFAGTVLIDDLTLAPVPEPGTYAMLLAGLGLVGFMVRRRRAD
jgi:hypothetical protein